MAFGGYLRVFVDWPPAVSALALLIGCTVLNIWGLRESSWANMLFTSIEFGGLLLEEGLFQPGQYRARFGQGEPERVGA